MAEGQVTAAWAIRFRAEWLARQLDELACVQAAQQCADTHAATAICSAKMGDALASAAGQNKADAALRIYLSRLAFRFRDVARAQPWAPMTAGELREWADSIRSLVMAARALDQAVAQARPEGAA